MSARVVRLTGRQEHALALLAQHRAVPGDLLQQLLGLSRSRTYELVAALRLAGLVGEPVDLGAGRNWIVPTRIGVTRYYGRALPDWTPSPLWSLRGRAAVEARLMLGATDPAAWVSERELSRARGKGGAYPYDGQVRHTESRLVQRAAADVVSPVWAVRADVARYSDPRQLVASLKRAVAQAEHDRCTSVLWVCGGAHRPATVYRAAERISSDLTLTAATPDELTGKHKRIRVVRDLPKGA